MKFRFSIFLLLLAITAPLLAQNQYVGIKKENLRARPNGERIADLLAGSPVEVLKQQGQWTQIQVTGWIWTASLVEDKSRVEGYTIQVSHILFEGIESAKAVLKRIQAGEDFSQLAKTNSIDEATRGKGGNLGAFTRGNLLPAFEAAAFALEVGQISEIVKTKLGYHIIKRTR